MEKRIVFLFSFFNFKNKNEKKNESFFVLFIILSVYPIGWTTKAYFACMFPQFHFLSR